MRKPIVFSYGGGRQTVAMCVAIKRGLLPRPDYIVMADTSRESSATWDYLHNVITPYLAPLGLAVQVIPHTFSSVDLYGHNGDLLIPAYTSHGKLPTFCSVEWKRRAVRRWLREQGVKECVMWLGYSLDEMRRMHMSDVRWVENQFPLIDPLRWRVGQCEQAINEEGLPPAPKSACWCCPHWLPHQWYDMRETRPDDFAKAVALDEEIRTKDTQKEVYLYSGRVPLAMADLKPEVEAPNLFTGCESGLCWT